MSRDNHIDSAYSINVSPLSVLGTNSNLNIHHPDRISFACWDFINNYYNMIKYNII